MDITVDQGCRYYKYSPPSISPSTEAGGKVGARLPSMATLSLVSNTDSLCLSCLVTSSSSLPSCLASCRPSLTSTSRAAPCQPPKVSTAKGMKQMPSAAHRSSYLAILALKVCLTPQLKTHLQSAFTLIWTTALSLSIREEKVCALKVTL